ncbi:MAG TPA: hypothetical protein VGE02_14905 [Gemmatimonadales bacterium]
MTAARTYVLLLPVALLLAGCRWGTNTRYLDASRMPVGATARLTTEPGGRWDAELLAAHDSALYVVREGRVTMVPFAVIRGGRMARLGRDFGLPDRTPPGPALLARLRRVSRFPQGLDQPLLARLLALHQQPALDTFPRSGGIAPARAADSAGNPEVVADFVRRARAGAAGFRDRRDAMRAGYRRVGMDFPAMGEHWVNPGLVIRGELDPAAPAILAYVPVDGEPTLVGVGYAVTMAPGAPPPSLPAGTRYWHEHNGTVDDESFVVAHDASHATAHDTAHDTGSTRLAILHLWLDAPNPDGAFAADNWALPFVRLGLAVPEPFDHAAARALSLATDGAPYYLALATRRAGAGKQPPPTASPAHAPDVIRTALERGEADVRAVLASRPSSPNLSTSQLAELRGIWERVVADVERAAGGGTAGVLRVSR